MDYQNYTVVNFILDEAFFQWVWAPDEKSEKFWNEWLAQHPRKREEVEEARWLILHLRELMQNANTAENSLAVFSAEIKTHYKNLMDRIHNTMAIPPDAPGKKKDTDGKENEGKTKYSD